MKVLEIIDPVLRDKLLDTARLDFLEKQRAFVSNRINVETGDQIWMITLPVYANEYSCRSYEGASPRAAIDQAIEKMKEGT